MTEPFASGPPPLVQRWREPRPPESAFRAICGLPHVLFLDSARPEPPLGRYSFLAADPLAFRTLPVGANRPFELVRNLAPPAANVPGLPPFQGGTAGLFSYDLNRSLERIPPPRFEEFPLPAVAVGLYDVVLAYDHVTQEAWFFSHGWPETDPDRRTRRAERRLAEFRRRIEDFDETASTPSPPGTPAERVAADRLAPRFPTGRLPDLSSNFSRDDYLRAVERVIEYIRAGDAFQVNLAQRLLHPQGCPSPELHLRLRERNAAPFAAYFDLGPRQLLSASPERFFECRDGRIETRPIKGTRRRAGLPEADLFGGDALRLSEKDRAENVMIVDLLRNDLSRVCRPESVRVARLCELETYAFVQHLVSSVVGIPAPGRTAVDVLEAAFPGGSITGAPKVRAMEIIAELEPTARGAYCGSLGYFGADGNSDTNILIRTVTAGGGWWQAPVGGGITAASDPLRELEETWHKAEGLLRAFT